MKNQGFWCIITRVSAVIFRQAELPFSEEDKVQMLRDDNRHLKEEIAALREDVIAASPFLSSVHTAFSSTPLYSDNGAPSNSEPLT